MKVNVEQTQKLVNKFRDEICKKTGILIEEIVVKETDFRTERAAKGMGGKTIMITRAGHILVDPTQEYTSQLTSLEYSILHELGHRAQFTINPGMSIDILEGIAGFDFVNRTRFVHLIALSKILLTGKAPIMSTLMEGVADCFALDVFPKYCSVSRKGRDSLSEHRRLREEIMHGTAPNTKYVINNTLAYNFFHRIYAEQSLNGLVSYLKNIKRYRIPSFNDMIEPTDFINKI